MKKFIRIITVALAVTGFLAFAAVPATQALTPAEQIKEGVGSVGEKDMSCTNANGGAKECTLGDKIKNVVNILLYVLGSIAVVMIVIGGIRYATSNGEASSIKSAKDTILYAVIGLVVAIMAYAIVNFVVTAFLPPVE